MSQFISCDWGTSSFRLRLIDTETQNVVTEFVSQQGIAATYAMWQKSSSDRFLFYESVLSSGIQELYTRSGHTLSEVPIIISGMASSAIGMMELEYARLPLRSDGSDLIVHVTEPSGRFKHRMIIVSGVKCENDVMRGEETIIAGCEIKNTDEEELFILPGTHSKHITIRNCMITDVKTYMTGELFYLLATKSTLANSLKNENFSTAIINSSFVLGVEEAITKNLLHGIFRVRTNRLLDKLSPNENYHYLSGLLIGTELKDLSHKKYAAITLVTDQKFSPLYLSALRVLKLDKNFHQINEAKALVKGQCIIYSHSK
ncbi:MAG TPA: 2-dehydro-3-deoxygalactonokinase [Hanamia sp.]